MSNKHPERTHPAQRGWGERGISEVEDRIEHLNVHRM
jgi:hypothetical protein